MWLVFEKTTDFGGMEWWGNWWGLAGNNKLDEWRGVESSSKAFEQAATQITTPGHPSGGGQARDPTTDPTGQHQNGCGGYLYLWQGNMVRHLHHSKATHGGDDKVT